MPSAAEHDRRDRILDAAERAFAECGFEGASLRDIVREAKVNLATVYYYFDSKNGLMDAVLKRRFDPLRAEQLKLLRRFQEQAGGRPLAAEEILEAVVAPPLRAAIAGPERRPIVTRLIGRLVSEPNPLTQEVLRRQSAEVRAAFLEALQKSLPALPLPVIRWRLEFVWGALAFIMCNPHKLEDQTRGVCNPVDTGKVMAEMISFFAPGFRAAGAGAGQRAKRKGRGKVKRLKG
ncbi:MAG TPA: TetR/AcrR family transcriptional regulator [Candidatus Binatia bacterium]|jgi:AcrR family transcriptional regulator|nr:TetR/AcrR family transcriptional regulator [Candidatus Binatia bacterium]